METRPLPTEDQPLSHRRSTSVLIRLVAEPCEDGQEPRIRIDAIELKSPQERHFASMHAALTWLATLLESRVGEWRDDGNDPVTRGKQATLRRTQ